MAVPEEHPQTVECPHCGRVVPAAKRCAHCHRRLPAGRKWWSLSGLTPIEIFLLILGSIMLLVALVAL